MSKSGYNDCLAVALGTGHYAKQCHAFQAKSSREVSYYMSCRLCSVCHGADSYDLSYSREGSIKVGPVNFDRLYCSVTMECM